MAFLIENDPVATPTRADGSPWPCALVATDGSVLFADTLTELVEQTIVGYTTLPESDGVEDKHLEARIDSLAVLSAHAQALTIASLEQSGELDSTELDDDVMTALFAPKDGAVLEFDLWDADVPLLLLSTNYAPFTDIPAPTGDSIIWLDGSTEFTYLQALGALGAGELYLNDGAQL